MEFKDFLIVLPAYHASKHDDRREINERAVRLMAKLGISDVAENDITEVSGGQLQMFREVMQDMQGSMCYYLTIQRCSCFSSYRKLRLLYEKALRAKMCSIFCSISQLRF